MVHPTVARVFIASVSLIVLAALACYAGYFQARLLPVRFHGEKLLISLLCGGFAALATYGFLRLEYEPSQPLRLLMPFGFFLPWGVSGEITVHVMAKRAKEETDQGYQPRPS